MALVRDKAGFLQAPVAAPKTPEYVVVELRHDCQVAYSARKFEAVPARTREADSMNKVLAKFRIGRLISHFAMKASMIRKHAVAAPRSLHVPVSAEFAQSGFVQIVPRNPRDCAKLAARMNRLGSVWKAYVAPRPVPAVLADGASPRSRNFEPAQGYLHSPPDGVGAMEVWRFRGGKGGRITICDIEGNWNRRHEDLPGGIRLIGGSVIDDLGWRNHGTAVLGEMVSRPGGVGTVGISHRARAMVQSAVINGVWNTAGAIMNASRRLRAGDVILIELQGTGPNGKYVAMQYWNDIFSAIRAATARGITVVEAAGNGNEDFESPIFRGTGLQRDSGAIVVGAGVPPTNYFDFFGAGPGTRYRNIGVPRSRIWFSNYGRIVNVQAWGWHVTTLGYGNAQGGPSENRWYTLRFSGTSSASPIVTGSVACIQGRAKARRGGRPLSPAQVRSILIRTGTPQVPGPDAPLSQHIGPQPNLPRAFRVV
ncbi:MAG: S8 family serine peptidase [Nitrospiraceae bacterium]